MILLTGGTGFLGRAFCRYLEENDLPYISLVRGGNRDLEPYEYSLPEDISRLGAVFSRFDKPIETVVHIAGLAHQRKSEKSTLLESEFYKVNVEYTECLAREAIRSGAKKFIFISSIGVHGRFSSDGAFSERSPIRPYNLYTKSKALAEQRLEYLFKDNACRLFIIRPPLILGNNAPGNFGLLLKLAQTSLPVPFGMIKNRRDFVSIYNVISFLMFLIQEDVDAGNYLISDGDTISTRDIVFYLRKGLEKKWSGIIPLPVFLFRLGAFLIRRPELFYQLCCDLEIDNSKALSTGWRPVISTSQYLQVVAKSRIEGVK